MAAKRSFKLEHPLAISDSKAEATLSHEFVTRVSPGMDDAAANGKMMKELIEFTNLNSRRCTFTRRSKSM